jgi:hypothetical protein
MNARKCQATTQDGRECQAYAVEGSDYCFFHDPERAAESRLARSKGGSARHGRLIGPVGQAEPVELQSMADVAALLQQTINDTLQLENSLYRSRTLGYLAGYYIRALDMAALERRVAALEYALKQRKAAQRQSQAQRDDVY